MHSCTRYKLLTLGIKSVRIDDNVFYLFKIFQCQIESLICARTAGRARGDIQTCKLSAKSMHAEMVTAIASAIVCISTPFQNHALKY